MTFKEIEKIKRLLSTIDSIDDFRKMQELESEVTAFFGNKFNVRLKITTLNTKEFYTKEHENTDKIAVRSFLESLIAQDINAPEIINILDLIEEGECSKNDTTLQQKYISKVFYSYSDRIKFDKMTEATQTKVTNEIVGRFLSFSNSSDEIKNRVANQIFVGVNYDVFAMKLRKPVVVKREETKEEKIVNAVALAAEHSDQIATVTKLAEKTRELVTK